MRWMGFADATATPVGPDGGVDVMSARAVGQVKAQVGTVGRPELQQLYGCAVSLGNRRSLCFSLVGYTRQAIQ
jgi:hypothetical protein